MTIEELEQQIKALQDEVDKLKSEQTQGGIKPWRADKDKGYWTIDTCQNSFQSIFQSVEKYDDLDNKRYLFGNYYRTKELAEQDEKETVLRNKVRQLRDVLCEGYKFIPYGDNYTICIDTQIDAFYVASRNLSSKNIGEIYFDTEEHAQQACNILNRELANGNIKI